MRTFKHILIVLVISSFTSLPSLIAQLNTAFIEWEGQIIEVFTDHIEVHFEDERFRDTLAVYLSVSSDRIEFYDRQRGFAILHLKAEMDMHTVIENARTMRGVVRAGPSVVVRIKTIPNDPYFNLQYGPNITSMPLAWDITTGSQSVLVGVIDSGISLHESTTNLSHEDLNNSSRILLGNDFSDDTEGVRDLHGHGTHVTGILSAETNNGKGIAGSSWHNQILVIKVFNEIGETTWSRFYNAVKYAVDEEVDIINFSGGATADPMNTARNAVEYAHNNNVLLVAAAGNYHSQSNPDRIVEYPAAYSTQYSNVIAVSATNSNDEVPFFSSREPEVNLSSPGDNIYSTTPDYSVSGEYALNYDYDSGTSMAAPHVAGVAALLLSVSPDLTPAKIRNRLEDTADKVPGMGGQNKTDEYGYGRLNAYQALHPFVTISGPTVIETDGEYTWTADAYGGDGNYTYDWYRRIDHQTLTCSYQTDWSHVGTGKIYSSYVSSGWDYDIRLKVEVQSANETATDQIKVYPAYNENLICPTAAGQEAIADITKIEIPERYAIEDNYPNPFNPVTTIRYELPEPSHVTLIIYDMMGREVRRLVNDVVQPGYHTATWDSRNNAGSEVASGMYLYRFTATPAGGESEFTGITESNTMMLVK